MFTGELKCVFQDCETGKFNVTFTVDNLENVNILNNMFRKNLNISVTGTDEKKKGGMTYQ